MGVCVSHVQVKAQAACAVCGQSMTGKTGVSDAKGRPVCGDCIEAARQLVARRESRKRQVDAIKKSESELARVEHDNSAVLQMSEDEVLALARYACANCGRVIPVAGMGCETCGFGTSLGVPGHKRSRFSFSFARVASNSSTLFPQIDPRIITWAGTGATVLGALTPLIALLVRWMWEGAIVITAGLTIGAMALLMFARRHRLSSTAVHTVAGLVGVGLLIRGISGPTSQTLVVWLAVGLPAIAVQLWSMLTSGDDWLVRRAIGASIIAQTGLVVIAVIRFVQVG
jgi:hypothetical protein